MRPNVFGRTLWIAAILSGGDDPDFYRAADLDGLEVNVNCDLGERAQCRKSTLGYSVSTVRCAYCSPSKPARCAKKWEPKSGESEGCWLWHARWWSGRSGRDWYGRGRDVCIGNARDRPGDRGKPRLSRVRIYRDGRKVADAALAALHVRTVVSPGEIGAPIIGYGNPRGRGTDIAG